jgi:UDP-N-acetylglucosamine--N-acetylmuramyl-(pentapeptide) pyrophosphoryl-undecaprenol N-acetylglucosamine transferase
MIRPVVIAAGGTGGHFFPAEALAAELGRRGRRIALMTDARSAGQTSTVFEGRERFVLRGAGIAGRGLVRGARAVLSLAAGTATAQHVLSHLDPAVIVGFGGYPAIAPILGSRLQLRRRPAVLLHEQNAVLGRANRLLARQADMLALSFADTAKVPRSCKTELTGNPVRPAIAALLLQSYTPPMETIRLLVLGGSLGARVLSDVVPAGLAAMPERLRARLAVTQQCRAEDIDRVRQAYKAVGIEAQLAPFFTDIGPHLSLAHLVICRAGASTVAELGVAGRPAIFVPLPGAIDDHQTANAAAFVAAGGGWLMAQPHFSPAALTARLSDLLIDTDVLAEAARAASRQGLADGAARLADLVEAHMPQDSMV